jgi:exodeoxyribonuclease V gamma subunit
MQHWLNMQLCDYMGISMNIDCPMPTRYIWDLCRRLLGDESVPKKSPYKRDILSWKIYELCYSTQCKEAEFYDEISVYWRNADTEVEQQQRVFTFARQLADLFEQYLVFRDDWLLNWQKNELQNFESQRYQQFEKWQLWFWNQLGEWLPEHPVALQNRAIAKLGENANKLPKDIYIFAINSISPIYLSFFDNISKYTHVHLFQLNPCVNYWGDAQSDIAIAKTNRQLALSASLDENTLHPLLRNLGAQGRDLNNLLLGMEHHEIAGFNNVPENNGGGVSTSTNTLHKLQNDILSGTSNEAKLEYDGSIGVHACHNEVRELQVLKDVLLEKFDSVDNLQPKDVLVMCPSIEAYSPYISSVFMQSKNPSLNLPVSISDRKPIESEPYIVAFISLLALPKTRFAATSIIDLVSLPAIANKFVLSAQQIDMCAMWLKDAAIDWGQDSTHVEHHLGTAAIDNLHTWSWGLSRLLVGMCSAIDEAIVDSLAPVTYVEGHNTVVLGRFMQAVEALEYVVQSLSGSKSIDEWASQFIMLMEENLLADETDVFAKKLVKEAVFSLQGNASLANFGMSVELDLVTEALQSLLSIPEVRSQFHTGNITFCSMLPMRSIPFKVIAILGLNQKEFPRQDNPVEIDLMQAQKSRPGDRSRRGDDRYLFLESLVSARDYLHLSYQHKHIKNNSHREPSLVLKMLIDYCHQFYSPSALPIVEHALHPFSADNFNAQKGYKGSYDGGWFACLGSLQRERGLLGDYSTKRELVKDPTEDLLIGSRALVSFFKGTLKYFANKTLNLYLEEPLVRDFKPFYQIQGLRQYDLRSHIEKLIEASNKKSLNLVENGKDALISNWESMRQAWQMSGQLPFLIGLEDVLDNIFIDVLALNESVVKSVEKQAKGQIKLNNTTIDYHFSYDLLYGIRGIKLNLKEPSLSHVLELWIHYLILQIHLQNDTEHESLRRQCAKELGLNELPNFAAQLHYIKAAAITNDQRKINIRQLTILNSADAQEVLSHIVETFRTGNRQPLLVDLDLAKEIIKFDSCEIAAVSKMLEAKWNDCSRISNDGFSFFPHTYFDYLLVEMPEFNEQNLYPYFACFGKMEQTELSTITIEINSNMYKKSRVSTSSSIQLKDVT